MGSDAPVPNEHSMPNNTAARLAAAVETVREISLQTEPQGMIRAFRSRTDGVFGGDRWLSLSRRDLAPPLFRITRSSIWKTEIDPWKERDRLPVLEGGLLGQLLYANEPRIIRRFTLSPREPAEEHFDGMCSLMCLPLFDGGHAINMTLRMAAETNAFDHIDLPNAILQANLFGRATSHLVTARRLADAYEQLDHERKRVGDIQRSLLPSELPKINGVDIAASYEPAAQAGGDYYDFFSLSKGRWGILIADVSGHGTPAAVVMAMLRTMLHTQCGNNATPSDVLQCANRHLSDQSDHYDGTFVTAFFGMYDPRDGSLQYACAGHNPPLLVDRAIHVRELDDVQGLPLAVFPDTNYRNGQTTLRPGDTLLLYTDGITEAVDRDGQPYGRDRLLSCVREDVPNAQHIIDCVVHKLMAFTAGGQALDDQTLLALRVKEE